MSAPPLSAVQGTLEGYLPCAVVRRVRRRNGGMVDGRIVGWMFNCQPHGSTTKSKAPGYHISTETMMILSRTCHTRPHKKPLSTTSQHHNIQLCALVYNITKTSCTKNQHHNIKNRLRPTSQHPVSESEGLFRPTFVGTSLSRALSVSAGILREKPARQAKSSQTVDGRNPAPPKKPWETTVCWCLVAGNQTIAGFLRWCRSSSIHSRAAMLCSQPFREQEHSRSWG